MQVRESVERPAGAGAAYIGAPTIPTDGARQPLLTRLRGLEDGFVRGGMRRLQASFQLRTAQPAGPIKAFGKTFPRLGPPIETPTPIEDQAATLVRELFAGESPFLDIPDPGPKGHTQALGPLTFFAPGLGNFPPGAGLVAQLARNTDRLVIMYGHPTDGELRCVTHVRDQELPDDVKGKVYALGSEDAIGLSYLQDADLALERLDHLQQTGQLDVVNGNATWIVHSQGGLSAALNRKRLTEAGLDGVYGRIVALTSPFKGSPVVGPMLFGLAADLGHELTGLQVAHALTELDPGKVKKRFTPDVAQYVDLSITAHTEAAEAGTENLRPLLNLSDEVIQKLYWLPATLKKDPSLKNNDGLVPVNSMRFGRRVLDIESRAYDHGGTTEDPKLVEDFILPALRDPMAA